MNRQGWYESLVKPACTIEVHDKPFGDEIRLFLNEHKSIIVYQDNYCTCHSIYSLNIRLNCEQILSSWINNLVFWKGTLAWV